jgi:hypothetical protein
MSANGHILRVLIPLAVKPRGGQEAIITPAVLVVDWRQPEGMSLPGFVEGVEAEWYGWVKCSAARTSLDPNSAPP